MTSIRFTFLAVLFAAVSVCVAQSSEAAKLLRQVNSDMDRFESLFKKKDANGVEALIRSCFAKSFTDTGLNGKSINLEQFIAREKGMIPAVKSVSKVNVRVQDIIVKGSEASGQGTLEFEGVIADGADPKKSHTIKVNKAWVTRFKKSGGKWWIAADKTKSEKVFIDGKPAG